MAVYAITLSVARAGVFFGRANVFAPESAMLKLKREEKMGAGGGESKGVGHKIKDGGYNNTNINKQLP